MANEFEQSVTVTGDRETAKAFGELQAEAAARLHAATEAIAKDLGGWIQTAGRAEGRQAALLVDTVKVDRGFTPLVDVGGSAAVGHSWPARGMGKAYELVFGSEFGALSGHGFKKPEAGGYWVTPQLEKHDGEISKLHAKAAAELLHAFSKART